MQTQNLFGNASKMNDGKQGGFVGHARRALLDAYLPAEVKMMSDAEAVRQFERLTMAHADAYIDARSIATAPSRLA